MNVLNLCHDILEGFLLNVVKLKNLSLIIVQGFFSVWFCNFRSLKHYGNWYWRLRRTIVTRL